MKDMIYYDSKSCQVSFQDVISTIKNFLEDDESSQYKLTIGTDSEAIFDKKNGEQLELITAIVIHRKGNGGRYFWMRKKMKNVKVLRDKIYQEVLMSIDTAKFLVPELKARLNGMSTKYDLEIHIDVGEKGETRDMIREVVGMVSGNGYIAKTKPFSYAASNIADRHI